MKSEESVRAALRHPALAWVVKHVPPAYRDDLAVIGKIMAAAATGDPAFAATRPFVEAHAALGEAARVRDLQGRMAEIYNDPHVQAAVAERGWDWWAARPELAYKSLIELSQTDPKYLGTAERLHEVIATVREASDFAAEAGQVSRPDALAPIPTSNARIDDEYQKLISKSLDGRLSQAEQTRLETLASAREERVAEEFDAKLAATTPAPDEYRGLIRKSLDGKLNAAEQSRLEALAGQKAVRDGMLSQEDHDAALLGSVARDLDFVDAELAAGSPGDRARQIENAQASNPPPEEGQ